MHIYRHTCISTTACNLHVHLHVHVLAHHKHLLLAMRFQQILWPSGKALGGSSLINNMVYARGSRTDYDRWAALLGCGDGWAYDDVLPYFVKAESVQSKLLARAGELRSLCDHTSAEFFLYAFY